MEIHYSNSSCQKISMTIYDLIEETILMTKYHYAMISCIYFSLHLINCMQLTKYFSVQLSWLVNNLCAYNSADLKEIK